MSMRQILNIFLGVATVLLIAAMGSILTVISRQQQDEDLVDLTVRQQMLVQNLTAQAADLARCENLLDVDHERKKLGQVILAFDQNLSGLLQGGVVTDLAGGDRSLEPVSDGAARAALQQASDLWYDLGMPLADLAAGEYAPNSAAGLRAIAGLQADNLKLQEYLAGATDAFRRTNARSRNTVRVAGLSAAILAGLLTLAVFARVRTRRERPDAPAPVASARAARAAARQTTPPTVAIRPATLTPSTTPMFSAPVDLDTACASVDQLSVDMDTMASSTEKMRVAIESVGAAMQGMLYSLTELSQDTAEGYHGVRTANNAACYTASVARDLTASAREMSRVVGRVTQLAKKTKRTAQQISADTAANGAAGERFTSVVASEVRGLAAQTAAATAEVEQTVQEILGTNRGFEEAIAQIIKNISNINRVAVNLGELMIDPPAEVRPGQHQTTPRVRATGDLNVMGSSDQTLDRPAAPLATAVARAATVAEPISAAEPVPAAGTLDVQVAPIAPVAPDDPLDHDPTPEQLADDTSELIDEMAGIMGEPASELTSEGAAEPAAPVAQSTPPGTESGSVFILSRSAKATSADVPQDTPSPVEPAANEPDFIESSEPDLSREQPSPATEATVDPAPEPVVETPVDDPIDDPVDVPVDVSGAEDAGAGNDGVGEISAGNEPVTSSLGSHGNVFILNRP